MGSKLIDSEEMVIFAKQLQDEILILENQRDDLEKLIGVKRGQFHRLCGILEIKGISLNGK